MKTRNNIIVWATGKNLNAPSGKNQVRYFTRSKNNAWYETFEFMNKNYPQWEVSIIYIVEADGTHTEKLKYYNFDNKKTYPSKEDLVL